MPLKLVIENKIGMSSASLIDKIEQEGSIFVGYDVHREQICDMMECGIVDSLQVVQTYV